MRSITLMLKGMAIGVLGLAFLPVTGFSSTVPADELTLVEESAPGALIANNELAQYYRYYRRPYRPYYRPYHRPYYRPYHRPYHRPYYRPYHRPYRR